MIFNLLVFVVVHHLGLVIVIMTLGAADRVCFAFLYGQMTIPAGGCLIVIGHLLMTIAAIPTVKFLELVMLEIFWFVVVVTLLARNRLSGPVESVMTGGAGIGYIAVRTVIEKHIAGTAFQIIPVGRDRFIHNQAADDGDAHSD